MVSELQKTFLQTVFSHRVFPKLSTKGEAPPLNPPLKFSLFCNEHLILTINSVDCMSGGTIIQN